MPDHKAWGKLSRDERIAIAERYVTEADANRGDSLPKGKRSMAQRHAAELMKLALATPVSLDSGDGA